MVRKHNKALGVAREGRLIDRLWDNGFVLIHAPRSAGGYPKRIFREKYPDIFKANKDKPIKPIDFAAMKKGKTYLFQVSKYKAHISNWEILVLTDLANQAGAIPILGWIEDKRWKLVHAVTKSELRPFENEYERFCETEGLVPQMGDVYIIHSYRYFRDEKEDDKPMREPKVERVRSEDFSFWMERYGNRVLNTTFGIWFYEGNWLHQRKQLKRDLQELIKMIDGIETQ